MTRLQFAARCGLRHVLISIAVACMSAILVFGMWYPKPYRAMLGVGSIYVLILAIDVVCGPLLTLLLANPSKSRPALAVDFSTLAIVQILALAYGMHSVWAARPVALAFERDRLVVVTGNQIDAAALAKAPEALRHLPLFGVIRVGTRHAADSTEFFQSTELDLVGISPAMRPDWWVPWGRVEEELRLKRRSLEELINHRPADAELLRRSAKNAGLNWQETFYLPLTTSKDKDWIALLDLQMKIVCAVPVDGFLEK